MEKTVKLNNGVEMPRVGLGVYQAQDGTETENAVKWAIEAGYRMIDTAAAYGNEESVGKGIRMGLEAGGLKRDELFVTTKLWNEEIRAGRTEAAFFESLKKLGLDYLDLYLIHWPADGFEKAWQEMVKLQQKGYVRAIGVSNFHPRHLDALKRCSDVSPALDQVECHPWLAQAELRQELENRHLACGAWSPLGGGRCGVMRDETVTAIAEECKRTPAQVILRWDLQHGMITIPKSVHRERIQSNIEVYDFELTDQQMNRLDGLNRNLRVGPDPDDFHF